MTKDKTEAMQEPSAKYQYLATFVVNLLSIVTGMAGGWSSPNMLLLMSDDTPIPQGPITLDNVSWLISLPCIGSLVGNFFFGYITRCYGRKWPLLAITVPVILNWLFVLMAENVYYLYIARVCNGVAGGGVFVVIPLYLSEIADDSVRGLLGTTLALTCNLGVVCAFILGHYCSFITTPSIAIFLAVVFLALFVFLPESPSYLVKTNRISDAEKSIRFYKNLSESDHDNKIFESEMEKFKNIVMSDSVSESGKDSIKWSDLTEKAGRKALMIGVVLVGLNQLSGCVAMLNYSAHIFTIAGSSIHPNEGAIIVGTILLAGSIVSAYLVDHAGRKLLYAISTIGVSLSLMTMGVFMMLKSWNYDVSDVNWIPLACFSASMLLGALGILSLPFMIIPEVMPAKLKDVGASFCMTMLWIFAFSSLKLLPLLTELIGFHGTMFLFAGICLSGGIYIMLFMPETKGRSYDEIMKLLRNKT